MLFAGGGNDLDSPRHETCPQSRSRSWSWGETGLAVRKRRTSNNSAPVTSASSHKWVTRSLGRDVINPPGYHGDAGNAHLLTYYFASVNFFTYLNPAVNFD